MAKHVYSYMSTQKWPNMSHPNMSTQDLYVLSSLQTQDPQLFLLLQPKEHVEILNWESCSWDKVYPAHTKQSQSSIPDSESAGDRKKSQGGLKYELGRSPGTTQENVLIENR